jgi:hypothetical protein
MDHWAGPKGQENVMFYVLYDLRKDPTLSKIHLPRPDEEGPTLLLIDKKDYENIYSELNEMNHNEGFEWMTSLIYRPMGSNPGSDLLEDTPYIVIAHMDYVNEDMTGFFNKLTTMRRWVSH